MDPSLTRRVVLLLDLHPFLSGEDSAHYAAAVLAAARQLLSFPPLSGSLFACKPFFSSLSPLLSTSLIHRLFGKSAAYLSFDRPSKIVDLLSGIISSASASFDPSVRDGGLVGSISWSRASLMSGSLFQLTYDSMWEPPGENTVDRTGVPPVRSNMIVMFSPVPQSKNGLAQFLDLSIDANVMVDTNEFRTKFVRVFSPVKELLISRDVHFSWLYVDLGSQQFVDSPCQNFLEREVRELGWSSCSSDAVALGAAFIPFGLIYSYIGCRLPSTSLDVLGRGRANLNLEISDICGKPLECKCCDLEVILLRLQREKTRLSDLFSQERPYPATIQVKDVFRVSDLSKIQSQVLAVLLLQNEMVENTPEDVTGEIFPDKILDLFREDGDAAVFAKPIWQLLLAFLQRRSCCALVSVNDGNGQSLHGYIMPFTVHSAFVYLVDSINIDGIVPACSEPARDEHRRKKRNRFESTLPELNYDDLRKHLLLQKCDANLQVDLEDLYFAKGFKLSKKLRFFQCWMKQFKRRSYSSTDPKQASGERSDGSEQKTSVPISPLSSAEENTLRCAEMNEEYPSCTFHQSTESFSESVSQKIEQILSSTEADLTHFAARVVNFAVHYFSAKAGADGKEDSDECDAAVAAQVTELLLKRPKDILAKHRDPNRPLPKVREHELQILFRMEMLQSAVGSSMDAKATRRILKDVCSLLGNIEFDLQGCMFAGGEGLVDFADRIIRDRYLDSLEPFVLKIYAKMEFLPLDSASQPESNSGEHQREEEDDAVPREEDNSERGVLMAAMERRERARRFSHFAGGRQNLQRVWAPNKQGKKSKSKSKSKAKAKAGGESSPPRESSRKTKRRHPSGKDAVCETPMGQRGRRRSLSGAAPSKALFGSRDQLKPIG